MTRDESCGVWLRRATILLCAGVFVALFSSQSGAQSDRTPAIEPPITFDEDTVLGSIAMVVSQTCFGGTCPGADEDETARVGTGFVVELPDYGIVLVTALHNVAGAKRVTYEFTAKERSAPREARVLVVSLNDDVALLSLDAERGTDITPLQMVRTEEDRLALAEDDLAVVSYGHGLASRKPDSDFGVLKSRSSEALGDFLDFPGGSKIKKRLERIGYPAMFMPAVGLEGALLPGDSGAPVLDRSTGIVIGMAHGGVPVSRGEIAWMLPAERIAQIVDHKVAAEDLPIFGPQDVYYAIDVFFSERRLTYTSFSRTPSVRFAIQIPKAVPYVFDYLTRISHWARKPEVRSEWDSLPTSEFRGAGHKITKSSRFFPGHEEAESTCGWELDETTCLELVGAEALLGKALRNLALDVSCYDEGAFEKMIADSRARRPNPALHLEVEFGEIDDRVEFSVDFGGNSIYLKSIGFIEYVAGRGRYSRVGVDNVEELFGGACEVRIDSPVTADSSLWPVVRAINNSIMRQGAICLDLGLSDSLSTPLFFSSFGVFANEDLDRGGIWGLLPLFDIKATSDDVYCQ